MERETEFISGENTGLYFVVITPQNTWLGVLFLFLDTKKM